MLQIGGFNLRALRVLNDLLNKNWTWFIG